MYSKPSHLCTAKTSTLPFNFHLCYCVGWGTASSKSGQGCSFFYTIGLTTDSFKLEEGSATIIEMLGRDSDDKSQTCSAPLVAPIVISGRSGNLFCLVLNRNFFLWVQAVLAADFIVTLFHLEYITTFFSLIFP